MMLAVGLALVVAQAVESETAFRGRDFYTVHVVLSEFVDCHLRSRLRMV